MRGELHPTKGEKVVSSTYHTRVIQLPVSGKLDELEALLEQEEKDGYELLSATALPANVPPYGSGGGPRLLVITKRPS